MTVTSRDSGGSVSKINKDFSESETIEDEKVLFENMATGKESKQEQLFLDHLPSVTNESLLGTSEPSENYKLQQELSVLKSEQVCTFYTKNIFILIKLNLLMGE